MKPKMKKRYTVCLKEVWHSYRDVEAESEEEALQLIQEGEGEEVLCEYSHTTDDDPEITSIFDPETDEWEQR